MIIYSMHSRIDGLLHGHMFNSYEYLLMIKHICYIELILQNYLTPTFYILVAWLIISPLSQWLVMFSTNIQYNLWNIHSIHSKTCLHFNVYGALFIVVSIVRESIYLYQLFYFTSLIENQSIIAMSSYVFKYYKV